MDNRITSYMAKHQYDKNCDAVWTNYVKINEWIDKYFGDTSKKKKNCRMFHYVLLRIGLIFTEGIITHLLPLNLQKKDLKH